LLPNEKQYFLARQKIVSREVAKAAASPAFLLHYSEQKQTFYFPNNRIL
jgi:hypothetical protein